MSGSARESADKAVVSLLVQAIEVEASDVHLIGGCRPTARIHGRLNPLASDALTEDRVSAMVQAVCPPAVRERLSRTKDCDFSFSVDHNGDLRRFRANVFVSQGSLGACFRLVPAQTPSLEWAGLSSELAERIVRFRNGLVLFTGVAGSGKTTSLAILINLLNERGGLRIITIEEPIEFLLPRNDRSVVTQREVGTDVDSFYDGLKYGLRQDPDVLLVGEVRDRDTAQMALSAAETGHLVFTTLHTRDAKGAISRLADLFPRDSQDDVRSQLSFSLRCVVSQHLLPPVVEGDKRVLALEVLFNNHAVASAIRQGKLESIDNAIQMGKRDGMIPLDESLRQLAQAGKISTEVARKYASDPDHLF